MNTNLSTFPWGHGPFTAAEWARKFRDELREMIAPLEVGYSKPYVPLTVEALIQEILG